MGVGPPIIALYMQLKSLGVFDDVHDVIELGAQNVWCPRPQMVKNLFNVFNRPPPSVEMLDRFANWKGSALELHEALGHTYRCIDVDPQFNSIPLDLNFDPCPPEHKSKYDLVTNHGTSEHLLNQYNFFKIVHELAKPGGFMLHAVPFTVHLEHGFFNYQPNFFEALARYNSYKLYGMWVGPGWQSVSLVPWEPEIIDYFTLNSKTTHLLVALVQKQFDKEFAVPFQGIYEQMAPDEAMARYSLIVDGEFYDGRRAKHITKVKVIADEVAQQTMQVRNEYASLHGQYWDAMARLKAAELRVEQEVAPLQAELTASLIRFAALQQGTSAAGWQKRLPSSGPVAATSGRELVRELGRRIKRRLFGTRAKS